MLRFAPLVFALSFSASCDLSIDADVETRELRLPILHGTPDTQTEHEGIVRVFIHTGSETEGCSGTLISENTVLTAAHCFGEDIDAIEVGFGYDSTDAQWIPVVDYWLHPEFGLVPGTPVMQNDIAILRLQSTPSGVSPLPPLPPSLAITADELDSAMMQLVGYGQTDTDSSGTRRTVTKPLAFLCTGTQPCTWWWKPFYYANIAPGNVCHRIDPAGSCYGDSGGPALVTRQGVQYVAGVTSWNNTGCKNIGCATKVDQFSDFIAEHMPQVTLQDAGPQTADSGASNGPDADALLRQDAGAEPHEAHEQDSTSGCNLSSRNGSSAPLLPLLLALLCLRRLPRLSHGES